MSSSRSDDRAEVSPVARPGSRPATSPPSTAVRARKPERSTSATAATPTGGRRSSTALAVRSVLSPTTPGSSARARSTTSEPTGSRPPGSARNTRTGADIG
ncbi:MULTISPECIES: hypothetical protein [unclassified Rathayibacter]|uniref:hypothetical protein n=1 Tax=unclassified Rathayibacter TaxID=2609250 RepID=UPI00104E1D76|nr:MULTISPECIES: hypothetical protein [unclassified Rathayibacter]